MAQEGKCGLKDIEINQTKTGRVVEGDPEWIVVIKNKCDCPTYDLIIRCLGFSTVEPVDPKYLKQLDGGDDCLVNNGDFILPSKPFSFKYAWKTPTDLIPKKFKADTSKCS
ncbi:hypothetical protein BVC80_1837g270 [Macleaya cordata]|uniref:Uncharacterized protein n=1 Tax=Macleaya cordata TaxID=56857 RepID=A0A200R438_MACCD|nr:hypothetical protein BVC80_1837g270 [Macleaya cordata]